MKTQNLPIFVSGSTLNTLISELGIECQQVTTLLHQLQLPHLTTIQRAEILAELLAATIHLQTHCGDDFQALIAEEMEQLPDGDEAD